MDASERDLPMDKESSIQKAIVAYRTGVYSSVRAAAVAFAVPVETLRDRGKGIQSRSMANEHNQSLSSAEERTLVKWISHLTRAGYPIAPSLAYDMAEKIRSQRYQLSTRRKSNPPLRALGVIG